MPELLGRESFEDELAAALLMAWEQPRFDVLEGRMPNWSAMRRETIDNAGPVLLAATMAAGLAFSQSLESSLTSKFSPRTGQVRALAGGLVATRKSALGAASKISGMSDVDRRAVADRWFSPTTADSVAATEITSAISMAEDRVVKALGVKLVAIWRLDPSSNYCMTCYRLNGKPESEWRAKYPNGPPAHPNCRCSKHYEWRK